MSRPEPTMMILKKTITNPKPDRRYKNQVDAATEWQVNTLWLFTPEWRDGDRIGSVAQLTQLGSSGRLLNHHDECGDAYRLVIEHLEPVEIINQCDPRIQGVLSMRRSFRAIQHTQLNFHAETLLMHLYYSGKLSAEAIIAAQKEIDAMDEDEFEQKF